jgi:membrane protease YdiL (CAAX protease family)
MTALSTRSPARWRADPGARAAVAAGALALLVWLRAAMVGQPVDAAVCGLTFGAGLAAVALAVGWRPSRRGARRALALGACGAVALVAVAGVGRVAGPVLPLSTVTPLWAWTLATVVVAGGEELVGRGVLFDACEEAWGTPAALLATSLVFALMHLPTYGLPALPLDLGVGLVLGGLRVLSGGPGAPAVAHVAADLAAWFL